MTQNKQQQDNDTENNQDKYSMITIPTEFLDVHGRIKSGCKKEFQFSVIEKNYHMRNGLLAERLGVSVWRVGQIKADWRKCGRMDEFLLSEFMRLHGLPSVPDVEKYRVAGKIVERIIERDSSLSSVDRANVNRLELEESTKILKAYFSTASKQ